MRGCHISGRCPDWIACCCETEDLSTVVVIWVISQIHSRVGIWRWCEVWQHLVTSSPQGKCDLTNYEWWHCSMIICCTSSSLHDTMDISAQYIAHLHLIYTFWLWHEYNARKIASFCLRVIPSMGWLKKIVWTTDKTFPSILHSLKDNCQYLFDLFIFVVLSGLFVLPKCNLKPIQQKEAAVTSGFV